MILAIDIAGRCIGNEAFSKQQRAAPKTALRKMDAQMSTNKGLIKTEGEAIWDPGALLRRRGQSQLQTCTQVQRKEVLSERFLKTLGLYTRQ